jgi:uncharacterized membrane protein
MAISSTTPHFSKKEAIKFGFELTKKNLLFFIGVFIIVAVFSILSSSLKSIVNPQKEPLLYFVLYFVLFVINLVIGIGLTKIALEFIDGKKPKFSDLLSYKPAIKYFVASLIQGIITVIGFILLIIPGVIFSLRLYYSCYLIVDKDLSPVEAVKTSWKITRGNTWNLFFFGVLVGLINILGLLCLVVGLFVTVPLTMLASVYVYRKLLLQSEAA